jgi:5'(3')-deoxyribonucleotidase
MNFDVDICLESVYIDNIGKGKSMQLFLDCDGVLADFDAGFLKLTGMPGHEYEDKFGAKRFWKQIQDSPLYFENLTLMPGALKLYEAVKHLRPIILTGCPRGDWAVPQKMRWRDKYFPGVPMVTCLSRNKVDYCQPGDVLVDDFLKHSQKWIDGGGVFVHHTSSDDTIATLKTLGVL